MKSDYVRGLAFALAGFSCLAAGDAVIKSIQGQWPGPAVAALRYVFGAVGLAPLILLREGRQAWAKVDWQIQIGRGLTVAIAATCFFIGLFLMPLADATAITFLSPMLTAILSAIFLKEPAPRAVWVATIVAFLGVFVILRPNLLHAGPSALFPIGSAIGMAALLIFNRKAAGTASVLTMQFLISAIAAPILILFAVIGHFSGYFPVGWPSAATFIKCALVGVSATLAHTFIYLATLRAPAALIAPMTYVQLLIALVLGFVLFGNVPDGLKLLGSALIVGSGLFLWRSQSKA